MRECAYRLCNVKMIRPNGRRFCSFRCAQREADERHPVPVNVRDARHADKTMQARFELADYDKHTELEDYS